MYSLGIDLGGTKIAAGIVDDNYKIVKKKSCPTNAWRQPEEIIKDMADLCISLCAEEGLDIKDLDSIGIAAPGTINEKTGYIEYTNNIKIKDFNLVGTFSEYSGYEASKIKIGNDANLAAFGEAVAGAAKGAKSSITITLGTGVGSGVVVDGKLLTGCWSGGAELGHMVIIEGGKPCTCGRHGCFEAYCSVTALIKATREKCVAHPESKMNEMIENNLDNIGGKTAFQAMYSGDVPAKEVIEEYMYHLATGIANIINIFQPEILCIGGGLSNEGEIIANMVIPTVASEVYSADNVLKTKIVMAQLANNAGIIGAAAYSKKQEIE